MLYAIILIRYPYRVTNGPDARPIYCDTSCIQNALHIRNGKIHVIHDICLLQEECRILKWGSGTIELMLGEPCSDGPDDPRLIQSAVGQHL